MATWFTSSSSSSSKGNFVNQTAGHHLLSLSLNRAFEQSADTCCSLFFYLCLPGSHWLSSAALPISVLNVIDRFQEEIFCLGWIDIATSFTPESELSWLISLDRFCLGFHSVDVVIGDKEAEVEGEVDLESYRWVMYVVRIFIGMTWWRWFVPGAWIQARQQQVWSSRRHRWCCWCLQLNFKYII